MGQKSYPLSLRFGKKNSTPLVQSFTRGNIPIDFHNIYSQTFWRHLRARTPVNSNREHIIYTHDTLKFYFHVLGWPVSTKLAGKPKSNKSPVLWYRSEDTYKITRKKRILARKLIKKTPCLILSTKFFKLKKTIRRQKKQPSRTPILFLASKTNNLAISKKIAILRFKMKARFKNKS